VALSFPNRERSYEARKDRVRFWGYDGSIEITFFIHADVLAGLVPERQNPNERALETFDNLTERIYAAANKVYSKRRSIEYAFDVTRKDF
jgi:hypothetical protein